MRAHDLKKLVIVGGGHASLPLVKMGKKWKALGLKIILISENPYLIYSGALPQFMGGFYEWDQTAINLEELCQRYGVTFIQSRVESVSSQSSTLTASNGEQYTYDYLLVNVGAETAKFTSPDNAVPVKPMDRLLSLREQLKQDEINSLLIAGGGAAGSELALNLSHPRSFAHPKITILDKNSRLLSSFPKKLSERVTTILRQRSVDVYTNKVFEPSMEENYDATIVAVGNRPASESISHDFKTGTSGKILTDDTLRVSGQDSVFAAGDTADVNGKNYREIGVHAVKQGVVLRKNIKAAHTGKQLSVYSPYIFNPLILSNGAGDAFYILNSFVLKGRWTAILKYILDMRWLEKYTKPVRNRRSTLQLIRDGIKRSDGNIF